MVWLVLTTSSEADAPGLAAGMIRSSIEIEKNKGKYLFDP